LSSFSDDDMDGNIPVWVWKRGLKQLRSGGKFETIVERLKRVRDGSKKFLD
jgi:hypothetical protein